MARAKRKAGEALGPTPERKAKGEYQQVEVLIDAHNQRDRSPAWVDTLATAVKRWHKAGKLEVGQVRAIDHYADTHHRAGLEPSVVANYEGRVSKSGGCATFAATHAQLDAWTEIEDLRKGIPAKYISVFERVVIRDEAAGVAGAELGFRSKQAEAAALVCVQFVSNIMAMRLHM